MIDNTGPEGVSSVGFSLHNHGFRGTGTAYYPDIIFILISEI